MKWSLISMVNNEQVLKSCLLNSEESQAASEVLLQRGFPGAAAAYNDAINRAGTDILVLAHQDVYLPPGWSAALARTIEKLSVTDPNWAVLGVWGISRDGSRGGHVYCAGLMRVLGRPFETPMEVRSLDELLLVVRKSSGVRFDEQLPGFHMYGTDICLEANRRQLKCYAIAAFCIHNTNGYDLLPAAFWKAYLFMRRKWREQLPVITSCAEITRGCWPMLRWNVVQMANLLLRRHHPGKRVADPAALYKSALSAHGPAGDPAIRGSGS
jgi:hypothetical protein